jgi:hypothetical protein
MKGEEEDRMSMYPYSCTSKSCKQFCEGGGMEKHSISRPEAPFI